MKKIALLALFGLVAALNVSAQSVAFNNSGNAAWTISTNNGTTGLVGKTATAYTYGLYVGAPGATSNQLTLVATANNSTLSFGVFSGGTVTNGLAAAMGAGSTISFQIRGWSTAGGASYEAAYAAGLSNPNILVGASAIISGLAPATGANPATPLFGTGAGSFLTSGFVLAPVPEPTTILLGCLGGAALLVVRRRK